MKTDELQSFNWKSEFLNSRPGERQGFFPKSSIALGTIDSEGLGQLTKIADYYSQ